jgi:hypothetical protein
LEEWEVLVQEVPVALALEWEVQAREELVVLVLELVALAQVV